MKRSRVEGDPWFAVIIVIIALAVWLMLEAISSTSFGQGLQGILSDDCIITPDGKVYCLQPQQGKRQPSQGLNPSTQQRASRVNTHPAIVHIESSSQWRGNPGERTKTTKHGTGTVIGVQHDPDGGEGLMLIVTCSHILRRDYALQVLFTPPQPFTSLSARIGNTDGSMDIAVLEVTVPHKQVQYMKFEPMPQIGDPVGAAGFTDVGFFTVGGRISQYDGAFIFARGTGLKSGMSGGPIYKGGGGLVGVLVEGIGPRPDVTTEFGGPSIEWLKSFLVESGYGWVVESQCSQKPKPVVITLTPKQHIAAGNRPPLILPGPGRDPDSFPGPVIYPEEELEGKPARIFTLPKAVQDKMLATNKTHIELEDKLTAIETSLDEMKEVQPSTSFRPLPNFTSQPSPSVDAAPVDVVPVEEEQKDTAGGFPWGTLLSYLAVGAAGATGVGIPAWAVVAWRGRAALKAARGVIRDHRRYAPKEPQRYVEVDEPVREVERTLVVDAPPAVDRCRIDTQFINVTSDHFQTAFAEAKQHIARRYPGAQTILESLTSLTRQFAAGNPGGPPPRKE